MKERAKSSKRIMIPLVMVLIFMLSTVCSHAVTKTYTSAANSDSKKITYKFEATTTRTGKTKARVDWKLTPSWTNGGESHGSPTKVVATLKSGDWSKNITIKSKGKNTLKSTSGSFTVTVSQKKTSKTISLKASGSGSYTVKKKKTYTYYTTENVYYARTGSGTKQISKSDYYKYAGNGVGQYVCWIETKSVAHTGTKTITEKHTTNSGTLKKKTVTMKFQPWVNVKYNTLGGKPQPETQGFIYNKGVTVTTKVPKYHDDVLDQDVYTCTGWTKKAYTLDQLTNYPTFSVTPKYQSGVSGKNTVYADNDDERDNDVLLYAAYKPNVIANVTYNPNSPKEEYNSRITGIPGKQKKTYRVPLTLASGKPVHPDVPNKGGRYIFLWWSLTPDNYGPGNTPAFDPAKNFRPGEVLNIDRNPYEEIQKNDKGLNIINLYAVWWDEEYSLEETAGPESKIRYIDKDNLNTLTKDSSWRSGAKQQQLEDSLDKKDTTEAKSVYDNEGNKLR